MPKEIDINVSVAHDLKLEDATKVLWEELGLKLEGDISVPDTETMQMYNHYRHRLRQDMKEVARKVIISYLESPAMYPMYYKEDSI